MRPFLIRPRRQPPRCRVARWTVATALLALAPATVGSPLPPSPRAVIDRLSGSLPLPERAALQARQREFAARASTLTLEIFPVGIGGQTDPGSAQLIAQKLCAARLTRCCGVARSLVLAPPERAGGNVQVVWQLAREFSARLRQTPSGADYALYASYDLGGGRPERAAVHVVVCTARGEWVIADCLNALSAEFLAMRPASKEDCTELLVQRLRAYLAPPMKSGPTAGGAGAAVNFFQP